MVEMTIPVGVARTVCTSKWYVNAQGADPGTAIGLIAKIFIRATKGDWHRKPGPLSAELYQAMVDALVEVRGEDDLKMTQAGALETFTDEVRRRLDRQLAAEKRQAEEQAAVDAKQAEQSRQWQTKHRERPLSPLIEAQRFREINQIAEDYGLDRKHVQIRAALVAAFHAGAHSMSRASNELLFNGMPTIDQESWDERFAKDKAMFERARAAAKGESA